MPRTCSQCKIAKEKVSFSKNEWSRTPITSKCTDCCNIEFPLNTPLLPSSAADWNEYNPDIEELKKHPKGMDYFEMMKVTKSIMDFHMNNTFILVSKLKNQPANLTDTEVHNLYQMVVKQFADLNEQFSTASNSNQTIINHVLQCIAAKNLNSVPNFDGVPFPLAINAMIVFANMWRDYMHEITNDCFILQNFDLI